MGHEPQARAGPERESPQETPLQSKEPNAGLELVTLRPGPKPNQESDTLPTECLGAPRGRTARENALRTAVTLDTGGRAPATTPSPRTHPLLQSGPPRHREDQGGPREAQGGPRPGGRGSRPPSWSPQAFFASCSSETSHTRPGPRGGQAQQPSAWLVQGGGEGNPGGRRAVRPQGEDHWGGSGPERPA